jgi:uncharacterized cupin superfamily protein
LIQAVATALPTSTEYAMGAASNPLLAASGPSTGPGGEALAFVASHVGELVFQEAPIDPDWILGGAPRARAAPHSRSVDTSATTAVWECTAGSFRWQYGWEETVLILEGQVKVTSQDGVVRLLGVGDVAFFAAGSTAVWEIDTYVRKLAFCRRELPRSVLMTLRLRDQARDLAKGAVRPLVSLLRKARPEPAVVQGASNTTLLLAVAALLSLAPELAQAHTPGGAEVDRFTASQNGHGGFAQP